MSEKKLNASKLKGLMKSTAKEESRKAIECTKTFEALSDLTINPADEMNGFYAEANEAIKKFWERVDNE